MVDLSIVMLNYQRVYNMLYLYMLILYSELSYRNDLSMSMSLHSFWGSSMFEVSRWQCTMLSSFPCLAANCRQVLTVCQASHLWFGLVGFVVLSWPKSTTWLVWFVRSSFCEAEAPLARWRLETLAAHALVRPIRSRWAMVVCLSGGKKGALLLNFFHQQGIIALDFMGRKEAPMSTLAEHSQSAFHFLPASLDFAISITSNHVCQQIQVWNLSLRKLGWSSLHWGLNNQTSSDIDVQCTAESPIQ